MEENKLSLNHYFTLKAAKALSILMFLWFFCRAISFIETFVCFSTKLFTALLDFANWTKSSLKG